MLEVRHVLAFAPPAWAVLESIRFELNDSETGVFSTTQPVELVDQAVRRCLQYPRARVVLEADQTTWSIELMLSYALHRVGRALWPTPMPATVTRTEVISFYGSRSLRETDALRLATIAMRDWKASQASS